MRFGPCSNCSRSRDPIRFERVARLATCAASDRSVMFRRRGSTGLRFYAFDAGTQARKGGALGARLAALPKAGRLLVRWLPGLLHTGRPSGATRRARMSVWSRVSTPHAVGRRIVALHDRELADRLRSGDERAFRELVAEYGGRLARLARSFSRNDAVIEEAVQETWLAVIRGVHAFEGRALLRTWIFGILVNQARRLAVREHRHAQVAAGGNLSPGSAAETSAGDDLEPGMGRTGMWLEAPTPWGLENPESVMLSRETLQVVEAAIAELPDSQRQVILLRDVEGVDAEEVCNILGVSDTNQRVMLHRGRAHVRTALDRYMKEGLEGRRTQARPERRSR